MAGETAVGARNAAGRIGRWGIWASTLALSCRKPSFRRLSQPHPFCSYQYTVVPLFPRLVGPAVVPPREPPVASWLQFNCNKPVAGPVAPIDKKIHNASTPCLHACQLALYGLRVTTISPSGKLALELICIGFHPVRCVYSAVLARFSGLARPSSANRQCTDRHPHSTNQTPKARHTYHMTTSIIAPACIATSFTGPIQCTPITGPH